MSNIQQARATSESLVQDGSFIIKDFRGFTVFEVKDNGDFYHKGRQVKL